MGRSSLEWLCFFVVVVLVRQHPSVESIFLRRSTRTHCVVAYRHPATGGKGKYWRFGRRGLHLMAASFFE
jgi:hypothetical protein